MDNVIYWLWLQKSLGTAFKIKNLIEHFGSAKDIYEADEAALEACPFLKKRPGSRRHLLNKNIAECESIIYVCKKHSIHIVTPGSEYYPERLLELSDYPAALFVRGDVSALISELPIGVIGSRTPSQYGENAARKIVKGLVNHRNVLIVSGGALGIDSVAHQSAIDAGGRTVLIMGCGHGASYLPENSELRKEVFRNGALVTEYPPFAPVSVKTFPERNRIVSGMSRGVVIVEAAERSGTFSTANHASRQGRDLFVLPGDIESGNFEGSNQLLSEGAKPIFSAEDVLAFYYPGKYKKQAVLIKDGTPFDGIATDSEYSKKSRKKSERKTDKTQNSEKTEKKEENITKNLPETISKNGEIVYNIMSDGAVTLDEIELACNLETRLVLSALTELELEGIIAGDGPNTYKLMKR